MNPYLAVTLVMCGVIFLSLAATAYMAVYFTRKARADLEQAFAPLATVIDGEANLDEAVVEGRFNGKLTFARMAHAEGGPVRVFQTEVIDAAGGEQWLYVKYRGRETTEFRPQDSPIQQQLLLLRRDDLGAELDVEADWFQLDYSPAGGYLRLTVPMSSRRDIPGEDVFRRQLEVLDLLANANRQIQQPMTGKEPDDGD